MKLFDNAKKIVEEKYPLLKFNKKREVTRLVFEIAKIKKDLKFSFLKEYKNYEQLKKKLISLRYPFSSKTYPLKSFYLAELDLKDSNSFSPKKDFLKIDEIFLEEGLENSKILKNIIERNPEAKIYSIKNIKDLKKNFSVLDYNTRASRVYLTNGKFNLVKRCPCTKNCVSCGYYVLNLGFGCPMECEYCFLQGYQNLNGILLNNNIKEYTSKMMEFFKNIKKRIRIGTGEFTDSLVYDDITDYSLDIISEVKNNENIIFEFKTKTTNIANFFRSKPYSNTVVSYSMNPQKIIEISEHYTADFKERLNSLKKLSDYGYSIAIHLDPLIEFGDWKKLYYDCINDIFSEIDPSKIRWISLGTFRFNPSTKKVIEDRFKYNKILDSEMIIDFDGKLRYPYLLRKEIYSYIINCLKNNNIEQDKIYLCMEEVKMWKDLKLEKIFSW